MVSCLQVHAHLALILFPLHVYLLEVTMLGSIGRLILTHNGARDVQS